MSGALPPVCISFGCLDPSGGRSGTADLKTYTARLCHGSLIATGVFAGTPPGPCSIIETSRHFFGEQLSAIPDSMPVAAVKVGLLPDVDMIHAVSRWLRERPSIPVVVDPVFVDASGVPMVRPEVIRAMSEQLLPRATIVTPNRFEAALLTGADEILSRDDMEQAARQLFSEKGCPVLITGGGLLEKSMDVYCGVDGVGHFVGPAVLDGRVIGAGCTLSATITAELAKGESLREVIPVAKAYVSRLIGNTRNQELYDGTITLWQRQGVGVGEWPLLQPE